MYSRIVLALTAAVLASHAGIARADEPPSCGQALAARALTTPEGGDVTITVTGCPVPESLAHVQVTTYGPGSKRKEDKTMTTAVASPGGVATVALARLDRGDRVDVHVEQDDEPSLKATTTALLGPDLAVTAVQAPAQILGGRPFSVSVDVQERNGDAGATATLTLRAGTAVVGTAPLDVAAGGGVTKAFPVTLTTPGTATLAAEIDGAAPRETSTANNSGSAAVEVTEFELVRSREIVSSLGGYGGHFNGRVYAKISRDVGVTADNVGAMEQKVIALQPQFSRIFINNNDLADADRIASFVKTVQLAQRAGATIEVTWQGGALDMRSGTMQKLAALLNDLVQNKGITNLRWLSLQNEPNSTALTPEQYEGRYRTLDPLIANIRGQVRYMGGDLVRSGGPLPSQDQQVWFDWMATHMADILDAWSVHIFWNYWDTQKLQDRLNEVRAIADAEPAGRKPLYVNEYGVRGLQTFGGVTQFQPGVWQDGTPMSETNVSAFQHAWLDVLSARLGYLGTSKWDSYFAKYDNGTQSFYMIGSPQRGWPLFPIYHLVRLWTSSVRPGWKVVGLDGGVPGTKLLAGYAGAAGDLTVIGLDTSGAQLNATSPVEVPYSIGGLSPLTTFHVAVWNESGDGTNAVDADVATDAAGVATLTVPLHGVFALTTMPVQVS